MLLISFFFNRMLGDKTKYDRSGGTITLERKVSFLSWTAQIGIALMRPDKNFTG